MAKSIQPANAGALDFAPAILRAQHENPAPLPRMVLYIALALFAVMLAWACFGRLDIIAVAQGKLIPGSYVKIVQPADSGIVREILVKDGQEQVLFATPFVPSTNQIALAAHSVGLDKVAVLPL